MCTCVPRGDNNNYQAGPNDTFVFIHKVNYNWATTTRAGKEVGEWVRKKQTKRWRHNLCACPRAFTGNRTHLCYVKTNGYICLCVCETVCTSKFKAGVKLCDETTRSTFTFHTSRVLRPKFHTSTHSLRVFNDGEMRAPIKCALAYATFPKNLICFDWVCDYFSSAKESRSQTLAEYIV